MIILLSALCSAGYMIAGALSQQVGREGGREGKMAVMSSFPVAIPPMLARELMHTHVSLPPIPQGTFYTIRRAQDIACTIQLRGCCCCAQTDPVPDNRCPEWTMTEVRCPPSLPSSLSFAALSPSFSLARDYAISSSFLSACHPPTPYLPLFSPHQVIAMIAADFRIASLAALLTILYEFGGLITGWLVVKNLESYHCEYI